MNRAFLVRHRIRRRYAAVGDANLARIDRLWRTLKDEVARSLLLFRPLRAIDRQVRPGPRGTTASGPTAGLACVRPTRRTKAAGAGRECGGGSRRPSSRSVSRTPRGASRSFASDGRSDRPALPPKRRQVDCSTQPDRVQISPAPVADRLRSRMERNLGVSRTCSGVAPRSAGAFKVALGRYRTGPHAAGERSLGDPAFFLSSRSPGSLTAGQSPPEHHPAQLHSLRRQAHANLLPLHGHLTRSLPRSTPFSDPEVSNK